MAGPEIKDFTPVDELILATELAKQHKAALAAARQKAATWLRERGYQSGKCEGLNLPTGVTVTLKAVRPKECDPSPEMAGLMDQLEKTRNNLCEKNAEAIGQVKEEMAELRREVADREKRLRELNQAFAGLTSDADTGGISSALKAATDRHLLDNATYTVAVKL